MNPKLLAIGRRLRARARRWQPIYRRATALARFQATVRRRMERFRAMIPGSPLWSEPMKLDVDRVEIVNLLEAPNDAF